jgi:hypothetical protein
MSITKFGWGHFPVGTTCVIHLDHGQQVKPPFTVTVTGVSRNGPNSYCIDTDTPGTVTEFFTCNIDHVAEITKRGPGIATLIDAHSQSSENSGQTTRKNTSSNIRIITVLTYHVVCVMQSRQNI